MAASWRLNEELEKADTRIAQASETLCRYFPLSDILERFRAAKHRNPLQQQLWQHEAFAAIIEEIAAKIEGQQQAIGENADLPADLPGRAALIRAGYVSPETVKALTEADLIAIDGIGATKAKAIRVTLEKAAKDAAKTAEQAKLLQQRVDLLTAEKADLFERIRLLEHDNAELRKAFIPAAKEEAAVTP